MKIFEQPVGLLLMKRDNLLIQKERLMGKHDPVSLVQLDHVSVQLTYIGRRLKDYEVLGYTFPSLKS